MQRNHKRKAETVEKKEKEKKLKPSEEKLLVTEEKDSDPISAFLQSIYRQEQPIYFDDINVEDEKSEKKLTDQVRVLIQKIKVDFYKESILKEVSAMSSHPLTKEQKNYIYSDIETLQISKDPLQELIAKKLYEIPEDDWDKAVNSYFSSFTRDSLFSSTFNLSYDRIYARASLYNTGKKYLEKIVFYIQDLREKNEELIKMSLTELYKKIAVCPNGWELDLREAAASLSTDPKTFVTDKVLIVCTQLAGDFTNEIVARRITNPLPAESPLKEISSQNFNDKTHAIAELTDLVASRFGYAPSTDLSAKNFFSEAEKQEFKSKCESPSFQHAVIETLVNYYNILMHNVDSEEKMGDFFHKLNLLGDLKEKPSEWFDKKNSYRLINSETNLRLLQERIVKRAMKSGILDGIISRDVLFLTKCDVIFSSVPFKKEESLESQPFHHILRESKNDYYCVFHDRMIDCVAWTGDEPTVEEINKFFKGKANYTYAILRKNNDTLLYFMQKYPAEIRSVKIKNKSLWNIVLKKLPKNLADNPVSVIEEIDFAKLRKMDPGENLEKSIFLMSKTPLQVQSMIPPGEEKAKIFDDIMTQIGLTQDTFAEPHRIVPHDPILLTQIQKLTKHNVCDVGFINKDFLSSSYISLKMFDKNENIISFLSYLLMLGSDAQVNFLLSFKNHPDFSTFLAKAFPDLKQEVLKEFFQKNTENTTLFEDVIRKDHFVLAKNLMEFKEFSEMASDNEMLRAKFLRFISDDDAEKMRQFLELKKYFPIISDFVVRSYDNGCFAIDLAATLGSSEVFAVILPYYLSATLNAQKLNANLKIGLAVLLKAEKFKKIINLMKIFPLTEFFISAYIALKKNLMDFILFNQNSKARSIAQEIKYSQQDKNEYLFFSYHVGNLEFVNHFLSLGADENYKLPDGKTLDQAYNHGVCYLIQNERYKDAIKFIELKNTPLELIFKAHYSNISVVYQGYQTRLSLLVLDPSEDGFKTLEDFMNVIYKLGDPMLILNHNGTCPALIDAIKIGNIKAVKLLMTCQATVFGSDFYNGLEECVMNLAKAKNLQKIAEIIKNFSTINMNDINHHLAIYTCNNMRLLYYIATYNPEALNASDEYGRNAMYYAIPDEKIVNFLIKNGVSLSKQDILGDTPLHLAASGNSYRLVKMMIEAGALTNIYNEHKKSAFEEGSLNMQAYITVQLLKKYITKHPAENSESFRNIQLRSIQENECEDDATVDWQVVLHELVESVNGETCFTNYSFFQRVDFSDDNDYLALFQSNDCESIHQKLVTKLDQENNAVDFLSDVLDAKPTSEGDSNLKLTKH